MNFPIVFTDQRKTIIIIFLRLPRENWVSVEGNALRRQKSVIEYGRLLRRHFSGVKVTVYLFIYLFFGGANNFSKTESDHCVICRE